MVRLLAFVSGLAFSFQVLAGGAPNLSEGGTMAQHSEWSRKFVHEPDTTGSLAGGTLHDAGRQECTSGTRVFDRLPFDSWQLRPSCLEVQDLRLRSSG